MSTLRARITTDQTYHLPGKGQARIPAGTEAEVVDQADHSPEQKRFVERYGPRRIVVEGRTATIPGERLVIILIPGFPSWTSVPAEALR